MTEGASKPGGLLALDLASRSGWAYGHDRPISGWHQLPKGLTDGAFFKAYHDWLCDMITVHQPKVVCWEAPLIRSKRTGGIKTSVQTAKRLMGLSAVTDLVVTQRGLRGFELNNLDVKGFFVGNRNAKKEQIGFRCKTMGFDVSVEDEADAIACWMYAAEMLRQRAA